MDGFDSLHWTGAMWSSSLTIIEIALGFGFGLGLGFEFGFAFDFGFEDFALVVLTVCANVESCML